MKFNSLSDRSGFSGFVRNIGVQTDPAGFLALIAKWFMRLIVRLTEPLLRPLQRMIPRVGMFDISPLIAFLIIWVCQSAVAATLLRAWPVQFF